MTSPSPAELAHPAAARAIAIIGGGPAGLMAAEILATAGHRVAVYDRMPSLGRKFLMAGRGGLNLTHAEFLDLFLGRYGAVSPAIPEAIKVFPPEALRAWADGLGAETFIGSSGRVFPKAMKASPLLRAWLARLASLGVTIHLRHHWQGWDDAGALVFETPEGRITLTPDATLLALGGASWPRLGADGGWVPLLAAKGIGITPLAPANCGFLIPWSNHLIDRHAGQPLKRIALNFRGKSIKGEAIISRSGLEGGAVYALGREVREILPRGPARVRLDLRPDMDIDTLARSLARANPKDSMANRLRKAAGLSPPAIGILREQGGLPQEPQALAEAIKDVRLEVTGLAGLDRAISTSGGIGMDALDEHFMLKTLPGTFVAGEMLDWEAATGGYLLQACFATGVAAARGVLRRLA
jgi:uncharacterized flavoprotein (TIGR03862 family)